MSIGTGGTQADGHSHRPQISDDGRYIAFSSTAANLGFPDTNRGSDVFVRDIIGGTTLLASHDVSGGAANRESWISDITADGNVLFESPASNLAGAASDGTYLLYLYSVTTGAIQRVGAGAPCAAGGTGAQVSGAISASGSRAVFGSACIGESFSFVMLDRDTGTSAVLQTCTCDESLGPIAGPEISDDGSVVVWGETTEVQGQRVSKLWVSEDGATPVSIDTPSPVLGSIAVSPAGRYIAYSWSQDWQGFESIPPHRLYVLDRMTGVTVDAAANLVGHESNGDSGGADFSGYEGKIAFASSSSDIVIGDSNGDVDVFVRDLPVLFANSPPIP